MQLQANPLLGFLVTVAGKAKDVAAGAVLLTAVGAVIIGLLVFWPKLRSLPWWGA